MSIVTKFLNFARIKVIFFPSKPCAFFASYLENKLCFVLDHLFYFPISTIFKVTKSYASWSYKNFQYLLLWIFTSITKTDFWKNSDHWMSNKKHYMIAFLLRKIWSDSGLIPPNVIFNNFFSIWGSISFMILVPSIQFHFFFQYLSSSNLMFQNLDDTFHCFFIHKPYLLFSQNLY